MKLIRKIIIQNKKTYIVLNVFMIYKSDILVGCLLQD